MSLSEFEIKKIEKAVAKFMEKRRPGPSIRDRLDLGHRIIDQSIILFEIRPVWDNPKEKMELPFAKATYVKTQKTWKIFWLRQDLKWHSYKPHPTAKTIEEVFEVIDHDAHGCFFG